MASATSYLERHAALTSDPYNVALITYALVRLQSEAVFGPLRTMKDIAVRQGGLTRGWGGGGGGGGGGREGLRRAG